MTTLEARRYADEYIEAESLDRWLDNLETLFIAIAQRRLTTDQLDRYARILQTGEMDALRRIRRGPRTLRRKPAA